MKPRCCGRTRAFALVCSYFKVAGSERFTLLRHYWRMALLDMEHAVQGNAAKDSTLRDWLRALEATAPIANAPRHILPDVIEAQAQQRGDAEALISARGTLSYLALGEHVNRYARWALPHQIQPGETVCLMMPHRPDYFAIWLGIVKVGGMVARITTQLRGASLAP